MSDLDRGGKEAKLEEVRKDLLDVATEPVTDEIVANAAGTTPEEIERGAEDVDMELVDIEAVPERQPITWGSEQ